MITLNPLSLTKQTTRYLLHLIAQHKKSYITPGIYEIKAKEDEQVLALSVTLTHALLLRKEFEDDTFYKKVEILTESLPAGATATITLSCASLDLEQSLKLTKYSSTHQYIIKAIAHQNNERYKKRIIKEAQRANQGGDNLDCKPVTFDEHYGFITMRKVAGLELHLYISQVQFKKIPFSVSKLLTLMRNIIVAVQEVHEKGLIHRDIKPENIIIDKETLKVTLIDFGYARAIEKIKVCTKKKGTIFFHAPELLTQGMVTTAADCFSLGRTLGELLGDYASTQIDLSSKPKTNYTDTILQFYKQGSLMFYPVASMPKALNKSLIRIVKGLSAFEKESRLSTEQALEKLDKLMNHYIPDTLEVVISQAQKKPLQRTISL